VRLRPLVFICCALVVAVPAGGARAQDGRGAKPDVIYVPTPQQVVDTMLKVAKVTKADVIYDLGSGDGRIPITAARVYGARGVGIDIDPVRIAEANANAKDAGVTDRVTFRTADLFTSDISEATVVTLYLTPNLNTRLLSKLNAELKPGTRVVSHRFEMKDALGYEYPPQQKLLVEGSNVYLWTIPIQR
jgi:cyclopropane fatty-acyl-phospholipid synthase-like methyltransferase